MTLAFSGPTAATCEEVLSKTLSALPTVHTYTLLAAVPECHLDLAAEGRGMLGTARKRMGKNFRLLQLGHLEGTAG